ncbi:MAG: exo-alpha-sialidase [Bacteroidaceae bacterium]|nr:exo-alpha-sialidase [Bacteroidaceae bacterium]
MRKAIFSFLVLLGIGQAVLAAPATTVRVAVKQGFQTTGRGNECAALLHIVLTDSDNIVRLSNLMVKLDQTTRQNISELALVSTEATMEFNAAQHNILGTTAKLNDETIQLRLNNTALPQGTNHLWLCAKIKSKAQLGAILDAALTSIDFMTEGPTALTQLQRLDLTAKGNPEARGMMVMDQQQYLFAPPADDSHDSYRIPAMVVTKKGTILAACDRRYGSDYDLGNHRIDVVLRRSTDNGHTWSEPVTIAAGDGQTDYGFGYGDPALVETRTGRIICLMAAGSTSFWYGMKHVAITYSDDDGKSWSEVRDVTTTAFTDLVKGTTNEAGVFSFFTTSGRGLCVERTGSEAGRVMFLVDCKPDNQQSPETNYLLYSDDNGESWTLGPDVVYNNANEAKLEQMNDGSLIASVRQSGNRGFNRASYDPATGIMQWGEQYSEQALWQAVGHNEDILYYSRSTQGQPDIMLHTLAPTSWHRDLRIFMSTDEAHTWHEVMQVQPNGSRYATMATLRNGDVAILFEDYSLDEGINYPISFITITKQQILDMYNGLK